MLENFSHFRVSGDAGDPDFIPEVNRRAVWLDSRAVQNAMFTSARFSVMVANQEGIIQLFNAGAERMLGYSSNEVVDKIHLIDLHDPQEVLARTRALSHEFSTSIASGFETLIFKASRGIEDAYELAYLCKDGSRVPTSVSISALHDDHGVNIGYLLLGADDSARRQLELKLNQVLSDAENAELAKANRLSNVCHELRTPLNAILGFAQLMALGLPSSTSVQKKNIDLILEAGWYQQKLISDVLDLALIESRKLSLSLEPILLAEIMGECQLMTEPQAQARGVNLSFPTIETSCFVRADRIRLQQVLLSLLSRAINSSKAGETVVVDYDTRNPHCIRFSIQDSSGLFTDPMAQSLRPPDSAGKDRPVEHGDGVGMILTKRLIELMGGFSGVGGNLAGERVLWFELQRIANPPTTGSPLTDSSYRTISGEK